MEEKNSSVKKNIAYDTFFRILSTLTPFVTAPYVARVIGAEGIGIQSYTQSIQSYFIMFASLGTAMYGSREIARKRDNKEDTSQIFWEIEFLCCFTTLICFIAYVPLVICSVNYSKIYLVLSLGVIGTALDISWFYTGLEKFKSIVKRNTVVKIVEIILLFLLVKSSDDLIIYISISVFTSFFCVISYWFGLPKLVNKPRWSTLNVFKHFKGTLVFFVPSIASSIYLMLDKPLLEWITKDSSEIGYYQQAQKFVDVLKSIVFVSVNSVVGVRMSNLFAHDEKEIIKRNFKESLNYIFFMGFGCVFGLSGIAKNLVPVFFGPGYDKVVPLIYLFSPIVIIIGVSNCLEMQYFTPCGRRAESIRYLVVGAIINLICNILLIPFFKAFGATLATLLAEGIITLLYIKNSKSFIRFGEIASIGYKKLIAGVSMFFPVFFLGKIDLNVIATIAIQIVTGIAIYVFVLLFLHDDWLISFISVILKRIKRKV